MTEWHELSREDKDKVLETAAKWCNDHTEHVNTLIDSAKEAIPPSGSDLFRPELWKGIHWLWYWFFTEEQ